MLGVRRVVAPIPPARLLPRVALRRRAFLLDSASGSEDDGTTSFLGCDPIEVLDHAPGTKADLDGLCHRLESLREPSAGGALGHRPPPLAVGYLAYEAGGLFEPFALAAGGLRPGPPNPSALFSFAVYGAVYRYEHRTGEAFIEALSARHADELAHVLCAQAPEERHIPRLPAARSNLTRVEYCHMVERALDYIRAGDIYQVNLAHRFEVAARVDPVALYPRLRRSSDASFCAYLDVDHSTILSTSPERFLSWDRATGRIETRPIKGTRPRGRSALEDASLKADLITDEKERAEHVMIVDLERNDLGRIAEIGSVRVESHACIQTLPHVHHLVSEVTATVRPDVGLAQVLGATFPGGSITGAPKVRAMQIIAELEPVRRGVYTGAIGYIDRFGGCDLAIAIRTAVAERDRLSFHVGGGIVADSDPEREHDETLAKARVILDALDQDSTRAPERRR